MDIECLAVICSRPNHLSVEPILVHPPKEGEVRVKLEAASICASDLHVIEGSGLKVPVKFPTVPGHEGAGIIESVGSNVQNLKAGDRVLLFGLPQCGQCRLCSCGKSNLCSKYHALTQFTKPIDGTTRLFRLEDKEPLYFSFGLSTFSQYTVVIKEQVVKIDEMKLAKSIKSEQLALLGCGIPTGHGSVMNIAHVTPGSKVAVWGIGAVGLSTIHGCHQAGAQKIIAIDINEERLNMARRFGATDCILGSKYDANELKTLLIEVTEGGLDYAFECAGSLSASQIAYDSLFTTGTLVVVGAVQPADILNLSASGLLFGKRVIGGIYGLYTRSHVNDLVQKAINGQLPTSELITHRIKLNSVEKGINLIENGKAIKVVIDFNE